MIAYNRGVYIANLASQPVLSETNSGEKVINFRVAINETSRGGTADEHHTATFVDVEAFGGLAELCMTKLVRGSLIFLDAKLKSVDWSEGQKSKVYLRANSIQFLDFTKKN